MLIGHKRALVFAELIKSNDADVNVGFHFHFIIILLFFESNFCSGWKLRFGNLLSGTNLGENSNVGIVY